MHNQAILRNSVCRHLFCKEHAKKPPSHSVRKLRRYASEMEMKKIRLPLIFLIITALLGCSAVGVPYTSDPHEKLVQAYQLMNLQRAMPAERLAKESLSIFIAEGNISGESEAHFVLGVIYKSNQGFERISGEESLDESILHLSKAQEGYLSINEKIQASKVTFEMAQAYRGKTISQNTALYT